ncbi:MAG: hypothetical protein K1X74_23385 [Pirellulales bacterium]|nr:hypothetical protein [Pirellulales bacterium]
MTSFAAWIVDLLDHLPIGNRSTTQPTHGPDAVILAAVNRARAMPGNPVIPAFRRRSVQMQRQWPFHAAATDSGA